MNSLKSKTDFKIEKKPFLYRLKKDFIKNKMLYLIASAGIIYYIIFHYVPMYGVIIAFKDFKYHLGILGSPWVGLEYFKQFFESIYFGRTLWNTLIISLAGIVFTFPAPIIFALLINEVRSMKFKRTIQTITYLPHFISLVVICGMIIDFCSTKGLFNYIASFGGREPFNFLLKANLFRPIYIISDIWQGFGWGSIIYLAALSAVDVSLYEAATIDGASKFKQVLNITIPCILPTITIMFILRVGQVMNVGFEKIILLYNESTYETADVISTFVYRRGILAADYSYSAAVGLFKSVINLVLLYLANLTSRKLSDNENSLW